MLPWELNQETTYLIAILLPLMLLMIGLGFAVTVDTYLSKKQKLVFAGILLLVFCLIMQNYYEMLLARGEARVLLRTIVSICGYILRPAILLLFFYLVEPKGRYWPAWILVGLNAGIFLTATFSRLTFFIDRHNHYQAGPLHLTCLIVSLLLLAWLFCLTLRKYRQTQGREIWIPLFIVPAILISILLDSIVGSSAQPVTFLTIGIVCSCMLYYLWLHLQLVRFHVQALQERQRMQLMLSQIKPHFLYNSFGAIEGLCDRDPKAAKEAMARFSRYLRGNLTAITENSTVPFSQELSHTRVYLELEQMRFGDALQIQYEIECSDFFLPPLTLEPLVENAVRHGIREKEDGRGRVTIIAKELPDCYELSVTDDGPGFDPNVLPSDGKPHVGIANVRSRLRSVCGGVLTIQSCPGQGTSAIIRLPKKGES